MKDLSHQSSSVAEISICFTMIHFNNNNSYNPQVIKYAQRLDQVY